MTKAKILLIEDDENFVNTVRLVLRPHAIDVVWAKTGAEGIQAYRRDLHGFASVIIDYCLPDLKGSDVALTLRKLNSAQDFLFASGHRDPDYLIDLLSVGGQRSFLQKGRPTEELRSRILDSVHLYQRANRVLGLDQYEPCAMETKLKAMGIVGQSRQMFELAEKIERYKDSPYPILIIGETGTGKELIARALVHEGKKLITVNCPRFVQSEHLLESELFGYVKGAFTGATQDHQGLLSHAHEQVVFLDELHQLSVSSQAKLLRFIQEMRYRRVGDNSGREISINFRLISAAKPEIFEMIRNGRFLEDLLHRVGQLQIHVPPLRDRPEDFEPLVRHFQNEFNSKLAPEKRKQIRISTVTEMARQPLSGNVRELQSVVRQLLTDVDGDIVNPTDFAQHMKNVSRKQGAQPELGLQDALEKFEREQMIDSLKRSRSQREAATRVGVSKSTFNRRLIKYGIEAEQYLLAQCESVI